MFIEYLFVDLVDIILICFEYSQSAIRYAGLRDQYAKTADGFLLVYTVVSS